MQRLFILVSLCLGCMAATLSHAEETLKLVEIYAKTGDAAADNSLHYRGSRFAVDELNRHGGLLGRQIELIEIDNQSTALGSRAAAQKAIELKPIAVIGASYSSHSLAMAPLLQQAKIVMITPISTNPDVTLVGDYIFRACFIDSELGAIDAQFARDDLKAKTAVVVTNVSDKYSLGLSDFFSKKFAKSGGRITGELEYLGNTTDFSEILTKIATLQPDVVFLPGFYKDSGLLIKQARAMHLTTRFLGGDGWNDEMYEYGGDAINGNYFSSHWDRLSTVPKSRAFVSRYEAKMGTITTPGTPLAYDAVYLLADAIRRANSTDSGKIRDALAKTHDFEGVTGRISFDENRDPIGKPAMIFQFQNGKSVYIKTLTPKGDG